MKKIRKKVRKAICALLTVAMVFTNTGMSVLAEESTQAEETQQEFSEEEIEETSVNEVSLEEEIVKETPVIEATEKLESDEKDADAEDAEGTLAEETVSKSAQAEDAADAEETEVSENELKLSSSETDKASGEYKEDGNNITWVIDADGKLTVEGTGEFAGAFVGAPSADVNIKRAPWYENREDIISAEIKVSGMTNAAYMFRDCSNLVSVNLENFETSQVVYMNGMFSGCSSLENLNVSGFDTENSMYMSEMFMGCAKLKTLDVSKFNTGNVIWMNRMFADCGNLESIDVSRFNTGKVNNFKEMFKGCSGLTSLNLSSFDTRTATNISNMFEGCSGLTSLNLSSFNTSAATNMSRMFIGCSSLESLDLGNFDTGNVTQMQHMFNGCTSLESLTLGSKFDTGKVTDMLSMFRDCSSLTGLDVSGFNTENVINMGQMFSGCSSLTSLNLSGFTTGNATNMSGMFGGCSALTSLDLSSFDAGKLDREEYVVFAGCTSLTTIRTLYNLNCKIPLNLNPEPETETTDKWYDNAGNEYTELPKNLDHSIFIRKNEIPSATIASGEYKENGSDVTWVIDADGKLTVEGTGEFAGELVGKPSDEVNIKRAPWYEYREDIVSAEINVIGMTNAAYMFRDCSNLVSVNLENFNTSQVVHMNGMFSGCSSLENLDVSGFDTGNVMYMSEMFQGCAKLKTLEVSSSFNTGNVLWMMRMFNGCESLESLDVSKFNTGNVNNFNGMFYGCSKLHGLNLSSFDTTAAENMDNMFRDCSSLESLGLKNFNTSNVTSMQRMFVNCSSLESLDLSKFDTGKVGNMQHMFNGCSSLNSLTFSSSFNTGQVTNMQAMFKGCSSLASLDMSSFNTENVTDMSNMLAGCTGLTTIHTPYNLKCMVPLNPQPETETTDIWYDEAGTEYTELPRDLDHSIFIKKNEIPSATIASGEYKENGSDVTWVIDADGKLTVEGTGEFAGAFVGPPSAEVNIKRAPWYENREDIKSAEIKVSGMTNAAYMFRDCSNLVSVNLENFETSQVVYMNGMFSGCSSLENLNVSGFDTENVMYMSDMFQGCAKLKTLDVSKFNTGNVLWMAGMFDGCSSLSSLIVDSFNTSAATDMSRMFKDCSNLKSLDLKNFDTSNVTNMARMFLDCHSLESLDLSRFDTRKVEQMQHMFGECKNIKSLTLSSRFDTGQVTNMLAMFRNCSSLESIDLSSFNTEKVTDIRHMFNGCSSLTSLDVSGFKTGNATDLSSMFSGCSSLESLDLSSFDAGNLEREEIVGMFSGCTSLTTIHTPYNLKCKVPLNTDPETTDIWYDAAGNRYTELPQNLEHSILIQKNEIPIDSTIIASGEYKENGSNVTWVIDADGKLTVEGTGEFAGAFVGAPSAEVNIKRAPWYENREDIISAEIKVSGMTNAAYMFRDCSNLVSVNLENFDTSQVVHMNGMFSGCSSLENLNVSGFDTENVMYMSEMFMGCAKLKTLDVSKFNTGNVIWMNRMFADCGNLESIDVSKFNTGKVENFKEMFKGCSSLSSLNLSSFDTRTAINISNMFEGCSGLSSLNISSFDTSAATNMSRMFIGCSSLESLDLGNFDTGNVTLMQHMFNGCTSLESLTLGSKFDTGKVTDMLSMFRDCSSLTGLDVSGFNTENVINMGQMFNGCSSLTSLNLSGFKTGNATNMSGMFGGCSALTSLDLSSFDAGNLEREEYVVFAGCTSLTTIRTPYNLNCKIPLNLNPEPETETTDKWYDNAGNEYTELPKNLDHSILIRKNEIPPASAIVIASGEYKENGSDVTWVIDGDGKLTVEGTGEFAGELVGKPSDDVNTIRAPWYENREDIKSAEIKVSGMTNAAYMFRDCSNLVSVNLENFNTSQVVHMNGMFSGCGSLENLDVSGFDTKNVTLMADMFNGCAKLKTLDVSSFNTENVTLMASMFAGCSSLESLDLSKFNTSKVDNFKEMFSGCSSLSSLNLSSFDTKAATNMSFMFAGCSSLSSLNISSFDTKAAIHMNRMFDGCSSLKSLDLKNFDTSNATDMNRMFLDCSSLESLDLSSFNTGNAEFLQHMFNGCSSLKSLTFGSKFNTGRVTNMLAMFRGCSSLTSLDVSGFNTENVTNMGQMFRECRSLTSLDVSSFKTGNAINMSSMFDDCSAITSLDLSSFDAGKLEKEESGMFNGCNSLTSIRTPYNLKSHVLLTNPESTDVWVDAAGNEYKELPRDMAYSILLIKNNVPTQESIILSADPESGRQLTAGSKVTLLCETAGAEIYYTISKNEKDLTDPTKDSLKYTTPIIINTDEYKKDVYIRAVAIKGSNSSKFINLHYTVVSAEDKVLKPYAIPGQGTVEKGTKVELKCDTPDAEIYYAVGGNADVIGNVTNKYTEPIEISKDMAIKAVAKKNGMKDSDFSTFVYRINDTLKAPTAEPASVTVDQGSYISLKAEKSDVNIYYTMDLTDPVTSGSAKLYESRIRVEGEPGSVIVIKAAAEKKGVYSETVTFTYTISGSTVKGLQVMLAGSDEYIYTGNAITPAIIVTNNGEELIEGEDYTVKYSNNVKAADKDAGKKAPKITVTGKGNLTKSTSVTFTINQKNIGDEDEVVGGSIAVVSGKSAAPVLFYNGVKLTTKDFDLPDAKKKYTEADNNTIITITGKGNFEGERDIDVKVVDPKDMKKFTVVIDNAALKEADPDPLIYDGEEKTLDGYFEVYGTTDKETPLDEYSDYAVIYPKNNINAGKVKFTVVGLGEYYGTVTKAYTIKPRVIKTAEDGDMDVNVNNGDEYSFTGGNVTIPDLTVTCDGDILKLGRDYKVTYSNNKKICDNNKAQCKISFIGNYKGSKDLVRKFNITAAVMDDVDKINGSVSVAVADMVYTGKPGAYMSIPYVTVNGVLLKSSDYNVSYYKDVDRTQVIDGKTSSVDLTNSDKQTVYMKIEGKGNYQGTLTAEYQVYKLTEGAIDLSKAKVTVANGNKAEYTGEGVEPNIKIEYKSGSEWKTVDANDIGTYVTVTYINNVNKGKATVMVNGNGDKYMGSKTAAFSIVSKNMQ